MRVLVLIACSLFLIGGTAYCGATYEWTDDRGGVHFTDDPANIPKKYRDKSQVRDVQHLEPAVIRQPDEVSSQKAEQPVKTEELYGGLSLSKWRESYADLRTKDELLKKNVEDARQSYATAHRNKLIFQRTKDRQDLSRAKDELAQAEAAAADNARKIEKLEADAAKAGVPASWREITNR